MSENQGVDQLHLFLHFQKVGFLMMQLICVGFMSLMTGPTPWHCFKNFL